MGSRRHKTGRLIVSFYFNNFKITEYKINGKTYDLTNITLRYKFKESIKNFNYAFYDYVIPEGYSLENLSDMYYDSSEYTWLIVLSNDIIDPHFDYPLDYDNFQKYIISKYGSFEYASRNIHHFERTSIYKNETEKLMDLETPIILDKKVYENSYDNNGIKKYPDLPVLVENEKRSVSILEHEIKLNNDKRNIKLLDRRYLTSIENISKNIFN